MCCAQTQSRECVNSGSMWYIVGWVLHTTMLHYLLPRLHPYCGRHYTASQFIHRSLAPLCCCRPIHSPSRGRTLSGGGTLSVCVGTPMLSVSPPCCGAMVERDLTHLTRPETRTQWHVLFFCRWVCVRVVQRRASVLPPSVC